MEDKKALLYHCAKELFSTQGFKNTNIADITKKAGISVGSFYNYYPSKDKLFIEIFNQENAELMKQLMSQIDLNEEPVKLIKSLLLINSQRMLSNPILCQWYNKDVFSRIEQLYREENGLQAVEFLYNDFSLLIKKWQLEGKMRNDMNSDMIMAMFESIIRIGHHKEEIGISYFPELQDHLTEFVLKGLTDVPK